MNLDQDAYSVYESDGDVSVCAVLLGGMLGREVAVNITTIDNIGTAAGTYVLCWDFTMYNWWCYPPPTASQF